MRFDDSFSTVLAGDVSTASGRAAAWRQLVDLLGRGRAGDVAQGIALLAAWRDETPPAVRAASGRALAFAMPPATLVGLFATDELAIAAPVLRTAALPAEDWLALLPTLTPSTRAVLRHRRDLPAAVQRGLDSFGATDFVLGHDGATEAVASEALPPPAAPAAAVPVPAPAEAPSPLPVPEIAAPAPEPAPAREAEFRIADLVARIDAFQRTRPDAAEPPCADDPDEFHFVTDAGGTIRWVEGIARGRLIGVSLAHAFCQGSVTIGDGGAAALRARAPFGPLALTIEGGPTRDWRLWGTPRFDRATSRFIGMAGVGRRTAVGAPAAVDQLRQLTHELRTPANAIAGFAELIGTELLGAVPAIYRDRAGSIEREAGAVVAAIDDLDTAARVQGGALSLRTEPVDLAETARGAVARLAALAGRRATDLVLHAAAPAMARADGVAVARLLDRMLGAALLQAGVGERIAVTVSAEPAAALVTIAAPSLTARPDARALLTIVAEPERQDSPLLGLSFTLRLAAALAGASGGALEAAPGRLTLRLPAAHIAEVTQAEQ